MRRRREVGLTGTEADDVLTRGLQRLGLGVDRERGGLGDGRDALRDAAHGAHDRAPRPSLPERFARTTRQRLVSDARPGRRVRRGGCAVPGGEVLEAGVVGEHLDDRDLEAEATLDDADLVLLVPEHQRDGDAALPRPGGAARAVQVGLLVLGRVVVHDDVDVVDVDAARGDVGGDEHRAPCRSVKSASAFSRAPWRRSPWIATGPHAFALELLDETVGAALGAQNTSVRPTPSAIDATTFTLSIWCTRKKRCSIWSTVGSSSSTSW